MNFLHILSLCLLASATPQSKCKQDACYQQVMKQQDPKGHCSKSLHKTTTAPPVTKKTTITVTTSTTSVTTYVIGTSTSTAPAAPLAIREPSDQAAECNSCSPAAYTSVCSCLGVSPSTCTVSGNTIMQTITVTSTSTIASTVTKTHITSTATVTAETSGAPCRIMEVSGTNMGSYLTSPSDSEGLFVQTTALIGDAWYWYLENGVLRTVNTTVLPHGDSAGEIVVNPSTTGTLGNVVCVQVGGLLDCHFASDPTTTVFVDGYDYVALYTPAQFAAGFSDDPLLMAATFKFDC